eukprot:58258_1
MADFETFEISIITMDGKYHFLRSSLQSVGTTETFQSLFDRLISSCNIHNEFEESDQVEIKTIQCECYSNSNPSHASIGCTVSLDFNVHSASKRHNFLRILYRIEVPSTMTPIPNELNTMSESHASSYSQQKTYSKFQELAKHLNRERSQNRHRKGSITRTKYKIHKTRESPLTLLFIVREFKSLYFVFLAGFLLFFASVIVDDFVNKGELFHSLSLVKWNFTRYNQLFTVWLFMFTYTFSLVFVFYGWRHQMFIFATIKSLLRNQSWNHYIYIGCYVLFMLPLLVYPAIWSIEYNMAGSLIVACEQTRFILKCHAYFVETLKTKRYHDRSQINAQGDDKTEQAKRKINATDTPPWIVDIDMNLADMIVSFAYFLFSPMLVYRTSYPRTKEIRWSRVFHYLRDVIFSVVSVWVLFIRFCIPVYRKSTSDPGNFSSLFSQFINGALPGIMLLLLGFFGFLHSWLNLFAELLRFGDRQFYEDWWNARSFAQYYRRWNCVVHDWIYNYVYLPLIEAGYSKTLAMGVVFASSSIIHEYILTLGCKFCYPVLLFMFGGLGVFFVPLTRLWRNAKGWNIFLWSMLFIGQGILLVLYSREWYARNLPDGHPAAEFIDTNSWIPWSLQLFLNRDQMLARH